MTVFLLDFRFINNGLCDLANKGFDPWFTFMNTCLVCLLFGLMYKGANVVHHVYGFFGWLSDLISGYLIGSI